MKKRFLIIFMLFILSFSLFSCKKERARELIVSSENKIIIFDKNFKVVKEFDTGLKGKLILGEIRNNKILFNYFSDDYSKSGIFALDFETGEMLNLTEGLLGNFPYTPKFYDDENILFTLKEMGLREYLYIYNLKFKNKKPLIFNLISSYIYPIYIDELEKNLYMHILKENETKSKIALYKFLSDEFIENYITFKENFYFQGNSNENGEILGKSFDNNLKVSKIEILNLETKEFKSVFETKEGEIYNETFFNNSRNILFKFVPNDLNKKPYISIIDRNGNIIKNIEPPNSKDFYIRGVFKNYLYLMVQEVSGGKYVLYGTDLDNVSFKKLTRENYFYGGDLIYSDLKGKIILSEIKEGTQDKEYILMNLNGEMKINLNEKLKIKIDSIIFFEK
ncbi:MAG: hypothetical protein N3D74_06385 [Caldisericia bacterium]|nr:hypothetical protein [Caldisericia bacterium]